MKKLNFIFIAITLIVSFVGLNCPTTEEDKIVDGLYFGVVGFNEITQEKSITNNITNIKQFIDGLTNESNQTAMAYGMKKGVELLKSFTTLNENEKTISFDKVYMLTFTDGNDNYSSYFLQIPQADVITQTATYLQDPENKVSGKSVSSYTVGFEDKEGQLNRTNLETLAVNGGNYTHVTSSYDLESIFKNIANTIVDSSINFSIITSNGNYTLENPKYLQVKVYYKSLPSDYFGNSAFFFGNFYKNSLTSESVFQYISGDASISFEGSGTEGTPIIATLNGTKYTIPLYNEGIKITV